MKEIPYWWEEAGPLPKWSGALPERVDVLVVGGGYTGLSAALRLARAGASTLVVDKESIGWGASSRNGGQVLTGLKRGPAALLARYGRERARALLAASLTSLDTLERVIAEERIECDYRRCGHLAAAAKPSHWDHLQRERDLLARELSHSVRLVPRADQRAELGSDRYFGLLVDDRSAALQPARYVAGLATAAARAGASLRDGIAVRTVERAGSGFRVRTSEGDVTAREVVIATNGYTDGAAPALRRRVVPVGSFIIATAPLGPARAAALLPTGRVVFDTKNFLYYFRLHGERLIFGGRAQWTPSSPASTRTSAAILQAAAIGVFPELAGVAVEYAWSGNVCFALDLLPHAGRRDGVHFALAYGGHGVAMATHLGERVAGSILGEGPPAPFDALAFPSLPLYEGRPWFLPAVGAWYRLLDWLS